MGSTLKEEQERVKTLLGDTISLLCKSGLTFRRNLKIQGLLGITLDDSDVFIVHLNEILQGAQADSSTSYDGTPHTQTVPEKRAPPSSTPPASRRKRRSSLETVTQAKVAKRTDNVIEIEPDAPVQVKTEPEDIVLDEVKLSEDDSVDQNLQFAIENVKTLEDQGPSTSKGTAATSHDTSDQPFITGIIPNLAESGNSSGSMDFSFSSNAAQGHAGDAGGGWGGPSQPGTSHDTDPTTRTPRGLGLVPLVSDKDGLHSSVRVPGIMLREIMSRTHRFAATSDDARHKAPRFLLHRLLETVFSKKELQSSKGHGLRGLDRKKLDAIKEFMYLTVNDNNWTQIDHKSFSKILQNKISASARRLEKRDPK